MTIRTSTTVFQFGFINICCNSELQIFFNKLNFIVSFSSLGLADASDRTIFSNLFQRSFKLIPKAARASRCECKQRLQMRKFAHNMSIANMRAGRRINHRRIAIQLSLLVGRSKNQCGSLSSIIFIKSICRSDGILISAHQQYFYVVCQLNRTRCNSTRLRLE